MCVSILVAATMAGIAVFVLTTLGALIRYQWIAAVPDAPGG
ncbi:hypothetical protein [Chelatococcus sambhunathii]|nr:hypothetical protein [Chelatococcus sambhunathii]